MSEPETRPEPVAEPSAGPPPRRASGLLRRVLRSVSGILIASGLLLVADAGLTVLWQEPVSAVIATRNQHRLDGQLKQLQTLPGPTETRALKRLPSTRERVAYAARRLREQVKPGDAVGKIVLPTLHKDYAMVFGDDAADLRKGPGVYPDRSLPGEGRTTAVAGHRTTYLAPFRDIDDLRPGDRVELKMPYGTFTYAVQGTRIVPPTEVSVVRDVGYDRLVLTACHPLYSAAQRIVVSARLVRTVPTKRISDVADGVSGR
jgi:sortase A